jgi:hypothetical protein
MATLGGAIVTRVSCCLYVSGVEWSGWKGMRLLIQEQGERESYIYMRCVDASIARYNMQLYMGIAKVR